MFQYILGLFIVVVCLVPATTRAQPAVQQESGGGVVISQIYGGGGNSGAIWRNDFVELFNRGNQAIVIDGWSIQYASATRVTWQKVDLNGRIEPGARYLIQLSSGGSTGAEIPAADAAGSINLSATAGKVALVSNIQLLGADCPPGPQVIDLVGYGNSASCFEGTGKAPAPSATRAIQRTADGCTDTNDNGADFSTAPPMPRNSETPRAPCSGEQETGWPLPAASAISGQKAGSILIYPIYSSNPSEAVSHNTRLSMTNTDPLRSVTTHLFFIDGNSESVIDGFLCLRAGQTATFLASDLDPGVTGYLMVVAVDPQTGCPVRANALIGDAFVKLETGHLADLPAHAVAAVADPPSPCNSSESSVEIAFDGITYNRLPAEIAVNSLRGIDDGKGPVFVLLRPDAKVGRISGLLFDDAENGLHFVATINRSHAVVQLSNSFPDLQVSLSTIIPSGRSGWMRIRCDDEGAIIGAMLGTAAGGAAQGHNLHVLRLTAEARWIFPVFPPVC